ncbi:hypothetical protein [Halalkalibaculum roseum]|nr:hypothetical protein [Halalkalibaculum roseum]
MIIATEIVLPGRRGPRRTNTAIDAVNTKAFNRHPKPVMYLIIQEED